MQNTTLIAVSTLREAISFYTRLLRLRDRVTNDPIFTVMSVELACAACKASGKAADCVHMLHLVPRWQARGRHEMLKVVMQDRPDLIESELAGLAFDSLHQCFKCVFQKKMSLLDFAVSITNIFSPSRTSLIEDMMNQKPPAHIIAETIHITIDPAASGPFSDYCVLSITRQKGLVTVCA